MINRRFLLAISAAYFSVTLQAAPIAEKPAANNQTVTTPAGIKHDEQAAEALASALQSINSISAGFEQRALVNRGRVNVESGQMLIKRPGQFRWDTQEPFNQAIISRDNKIWVVDTDLMQVIIKKQNDTLGPTPVQLLSGNAREFLKDYLVIRVGDKSKELVYTLRPKAANDLFEQLDITFQKGLLLSMTMNDSLGGKRQITFTNVAVNRKVDDQRFRVDIPKGFDVIDETRS